MAEPEPTETTGEHFVARSQEMERLTAFLDQALNNKGQVVFVEGEAGTGKSMLVAEFERLAQSLHTELLLAVGICDPQAGNGLPYASFREVLAVLTKSAAPRALKGNVSKENTSRLTKTLGLVADTLYTFGPDLLGIFLPGATVFTKMGQHALEKVGWVDKLRKSFADKHKGHKLLSTEGMTQDQLIEQYVNVIRALAEKAPLLIVLEDLHWADNVSVDLLFRLSRRLDNARVLIIGTYRPHELRKANSEEASPLEKALNEIKRYRGDVFVDLNRACAERGRYFIDALLDCEPNQLDEAFRARLYERTEGQPLFTVELLRSMQDRGDIVKDGAGRWMARKKFDWGNMPARVEGVIASRISGLPAEMRDSLSVASVEGEQFTAEVIAKVKSADARELVRQFSGDLQKVYQLVEGLEVKRIGQQRLSRYRFANNLFHRYLYDNFDPVELSYQHEAVGLALEALYGEQVDDIAPALARHFELAALTDKARTYLSIAGERAIADYAYTAALDFFSRALQLTPPDDAAARYPLLANRQRMHDLLGQRDAQRADLDELGQLDAVMPVDPQRTAELYIGRAILARRTSDFQAVIAEVQRAIQLIQANPELGSVAFTLLVDGYLLWGRAQSLLGDNEQALSQLEKALMVSRAYKYALGECGAQNLLGMIHWAAGNYGEANDHLNEALPLARSIGDLRRESEALQNLGVVASDEQRYDDAISFYQQAQAIAQRSGDRATETGLLINLGGLRQDMLDYEQARVITTQAVQLAAELNDRMMHTIALINLGELERELGLYAQAEVDAARAFELAQAIRYRRGQAILLANRGRIALAQGLAEQAFCLGQDALTLAREIGSRYAQDQATLIIGQALLQLCRWTEAEQHYTTALADWQDGEDVTQQVEARVGYAAAAMGRSITELQLDETISLMLNPQKQTQSLPLWSYLQCARILLARQDGRAMAMIARAQSEVQSRASRMVDADTRHSYLNIADHRAILALA